VAGAYTATLVVQANGVVSKPDTVSITCSTGNIAPRANAGPDRSAAPGGTITLDGTASRDPNNTALTYSWRIVTQPSGSNPVLTSAITATPTFRADVPGVYTVALTVSDGSLTSAVDQAIITVATGNLPPVANAGPDQTVTTGQLVTLNGTGSTDPNGDPLTYSWCLRGRPQGSTATLNGANTARPTFTPDVAGSYVLCLTVNDGQSGSASDSVVVEARPAGFATGVLEAYVKASNPGSRLVFIDGIGERPIGDGFGTNIALSDETLVVGAPGEESCATGINGDQANNGCPGAGALYVFTRTSESWSQQAYIKASDSHANGGLGNLVALSADTLATTGTSENGAGVVYVFTRTNGTWSQQAIVTPINVQVGQFFGFSLALDGDTLVVGDHADSTCASGINGDPSVINSGCHSGAAYVFRRTNGVWIQEAYIKPPSRVDNTPYGFGYSVAVNGNTMAVGAESESGCARGVNGDETLLGCIVTGAVYVYSRSDGTWAKEAYIKASNPDPSDGFGANVALSSDTLAVHAIDEDSCATGVNGDQFNNSCSATAGAVYVFTRSNGTWSQQAYLKASNTERIDAFGQKGLAISGDTLAVSAYTEASCATGINGNQADNSCPGAGAVYVFKRSAGIWVQEAYVKATNTESGDQFASVALSNGILAVGALGEDSCASGINGDQMDNSCPFAGAVYVYTGQ
jgi:hypothetical protein